ncbi:MAG TPA: methyltransferase domain-containing protein [Anaerolineales bacterium]|nr:methyltransferase domain-containing protein [Anaerolineales bacterium]
MHQLSNYHQKRITRASAPQTRGVVMNWGGFYDLVMWFLTLGNERTLRQRIAGLIHYQPGEKVLDVGCGTGSLALVAKEHVGDAGSVHGIDPAPRQIARARAKAARRGLSADFRLGVIERLPFPDETFDLVQSTFAIDHVPADLQRQGLKEIARVLKPGGRLFILITGSVQDLAMFMKEAGFSQVETGETEYRGLGMARLYFVRGQIAAGA